MKVENLDWKLNRGLESEFYHRTLSHLKDCNYYDASSFFQIYNKIHDQIQWKINDFLQIKIWDVVKDTFYGGLGDE